MKYYFESYGILIAKPIKELVNNSEKYNILFIDNQIKDYNDPPICRHLCGHVPKELRKHEDYKNILY